MDRPEDPRTYVALEFEAWPYPRYRVNCKHNDPACVSARRQFYSFAEGAGALIDNHTEYHTRKEHR